MASSSMLWTHAHFSACRPQSSSIGSVARPGTSITSSADFNSCSLGSPTFIRPKLSQVTARAKKSKKSKTPPEPAPKDAEPEEVEVELSWVEEKAEDLVQYVQTAVKAIPGPRVRGGEVPWLLAAPLGYAAISLLFAVVKTLRKMSSPREKRRQQIGKNAWLCETLGEYLPFQREDLTPKVFEGITKRCKFQADEAVRKYVRYALNERPFNPELVADLIHLKAVSGLDDAAVAEILNEVSRRIVKAKGPVVMNTIGFTEKGLKRKAAVQALFSKIFYLAELDQFCSPEHRKSLTIKEIFGVTEEDANSIRIESLSGATELESLEKSVGSGSDDESEEKEKDDD